MNRPQIIIDPDRCKQDGLCVKLCPMRIFEQPEQGVVQVRNEQLCVYCSHCVAACPNDAIVHDGLDAGRIARIKCRSPAEPEALRQAFCQRRSVRMYKDKPVPRELVDQVVEVAGFAPTAAHGQGGKTRQVVVVSGQRHMKRCLELTVDYMRQLEKLLEGTMVKLAARWLDEPRRGISMLPDLRMRLAEFERGRDAILYEAPMAIFVHTAGTNPDPVTDCSAAMLSMMVFAQSLGLGTCWNGWLAMAGSGAKVKACTEFREFLRLPPEHDVFAAATMGYAGVKLHSLPDRRTELRWIGEEQSAE